jgi:hypothetical protein
MGLARSLREVASGVCVGGCEGRTSGGMGEFGSQSGAREVRRVVCRASSWALMEVVKGL